ncbi:MAG: nitroreductase/quinone reductase family protein [Acidimicrobiales bacterium]|jgi:deazaflavin-dependent oxidoreductase (nitroreductase family)
MLNKFTAPKSAPAGLLRIQRWIYVHTDGRVGPGMIGAWTLLLRTVGRRTGRPRLTVLVFATDGGKFILAASNDGKDLAPAWFLNLCARPEVEVQVGRKRFSGNALVIHSTDSDYRRLWELMNRTNHRRYDAYQSKTSRSIPLIVIVPNVEMPGC